jgi:hypothetical protein
MKSFKLFLIGYKIIFLPHISPFYYSVTLLCSAKKLKSQTKILIFRFNQKNLNDFNWKNIQKVELYSFEKKKKSEEYNSKDLNQKSFVKCKTEMIIPHLVALEKYEMDVLIEKKFYVLRLYFPKSRIDFIYMPFQGVLYRMNHGNEYFKIVKRDDFNKLIEDLTKEKG